MSSDETQLVQLQFDRFAHNWRKRNAASEYPRYAEVRSRFELELSELASFISSEDLGAFRPDICEVSYIDHVLPGSRPRHLGAMGDLLRFWSPDFSISGLGEPAEASCALRFPLLDSTNSPAGSVYLSVQPAIRDADQAKIFAYEISARIKTGGLSIADVMSSLDRCHDAGLSLFREVTDRSLLSQWEA